MRAASDSLRYRTRELDTCTFYTFAPPLKLSLMYLPFVY